MTDKELIDAFLAGEIDDAGMAQLEAELEKNPELLHELAEERGMDQALRVLMGDGTADQQVTVSVLAVLRSAPEDQFKTDLLEKVKAEDLKKKNEEQALRVTTAVPPPLPGAAGRSASRRPRRSRSRPWGASLREGPWNRPPPPPPSSSRPRRAPRSTAATRRSPPRRT